MGESSQITLVQLTPHILITSPPAGAAFNGGPNPDTIQVQGTVFLTCDDPGGDCDVGKITGVTVAIGSSVIKAATLTLDPAPAPGTVQSGSWHFSGTPAPSDTGTTNVTATVTMREGAGPKTATASASITVDIRNAGTGGGGHSCADLTRELMQLVSLEATASDPELQALIEKSIKNVTLQLQQQGCTPVPVPSTLTGKVLIETDNSSLAGPFDVPVSLQLVFSGNQVSLGPIDITVSGAHVTGNGGLGTFDPSTGETVIQAPVTADTSDGTLNLNFTLSTESGEARRPFTPQGIRLTSDGSVILSGAASDTLFGVGVNVLLTISGTVSPAP